MVNAERLAKKTREIIDAGLFLHDRGWVPATSGNFSARLDRDWAAVTASGKHKGRLAHNDVLAVDMDGRPLNAGARPSAETLLHTALYRELPEVGAVLHTHSIADTVISRASQGDELVLTDYEVLKAFAGVKSHKTSLVTPVFANTQDMAALAAAVTERLRAQANLWGFLIRGHGLYVWGASMPDALRHVEAYQFLFACELEARRIGL